VRTSTIEVRKDRVTVHVDNQRVLDWKADVGDWRLRQEGLPGLGTSGSPTEFRKIRLFEVAGRGRPLRPRGN
jgi:membrane protease subunit (stomatin/prohibitin family)